MSTDLTMLRGDDWTFEATLVDENGDPFDLTGVELAFTVGDDFTKTLADGITVTAPLTGVASIAIAAADTDGWPCVRTVRRWALRTTLADGTIRTPLRGLFIVMPVPEPVT